MIKISPGEHYLVQQHDWKSGQRIDSSVCVASICPRSPNVPEHAVLTQINTDGKPGQSVHVFPPDYQSGSIPIVRVVSQFEPRFIESFSKIEK